MKRIIEWFKERAAIHSNWLQLAVQFIKFGLVGVSNTAISYGVELLFFYVILIETSAQEHVKVLITSICAFVISVTNSYIWNNRFVFKLEAKGWRTHFLAYFKTVVSYGVTGLLLSPVVKMMLVAKEIPYYWASLISLIITIPLNFIINKFWAFRQTK